MGKLQDIGYYSLIDGYKDIFYNPMTRTYVKGTDFSDIVALYEFDENLRSLVFKYICHIEQKIRSLISYSFCEAFSENQSAYLNSANYNISNKNSRDISKLISILTYEANNRHAIYNHTSQSHSLIWIETLENLLLLHKLPVFEFLAPLYDMLPPETILVAFLLFCIILSCVFLRFYVFLSYKKKDNLSTTFSSTITLQQIP